MIAEQLIYRPLIVDCPKTYTPQSPLIDAANRGEIVSEEEAIKAYFSTMRQGDPDYFDNVLATTERLSSPPHRFELIVPAYREAENMDRFLSLMKTQFEQSRDGDWGVTLVADYSIPPKKEKEQPAFRQMVAGMDHFLKLNPQHKDRVQMIFSVKTKEMPTGALGVGLARKFGEDVVMLGRLSASNNGPAKDKPLYLGLMDMDTTALTPGLFASMIEAMPQNEFEQPRVIRVKGSYDKTEISQHHYIHPLQEIWEESISAIARYTKHNPFNLGRLSAVPARELAMTGGGFAKKLNFTDEDIRHGIQIAWQLNNVETVEVPGKYATSARRELQQMLQGLIALLENNGGAFDVETLETAALMRMYGNWDNVAFRNHLGNILGAKDFDQKHLPGITSAIANAFYRFTLFGIFAAEKLARSPLTPEVGVIRQEFLGGQIPYFEVQIQTHELIQRLADRDPNRFKSILPILMEVDNQAKAVMSEILRKNRIKFHYANPEQPMLGFLEPGVKISRGTEADKIILRGPFIIEPDQSEYLEKIRLDLAEDI